MVNEGRFLLETLEELLMSPWALELHGLCFAVGLFSLSQKPVCLFNEESSVFLVQ